MRMRNVLGIEAGPDKLPVCGFGAVAERAGELSVCFNATSSALYKEVIIRNNIQLHSITQRHILFLFFCFTFLWAKRPMSMKREQIEWTYGLTPGFIPGRATPNLGRATGTLDVVLLIP